MTVRLATSDGRKDRCGFPNSKRSDLVGGDLSSTRDDFIMSDGRNEAHGMRRPSVDASMALEFAPATPETRIKRGENPAWR